MPLFTAVPPNACSVAFSNGLPAFLSGGLPGTTVSETFVGAAPNIPSPADVGIAMSGSTPGPANNTGVITPVHVGWNFFAGDTANATVLGRMVHRRHAWKLVAVHYGSIVFDTLNLVRLITSTPPSQVDAADYDLRLLAIPGLNVEVFWLAARSATSTDFVIHTPTFIPALHMGYPNSPLLIQNFLTDIRPLAADLLTMGAGYGA